MSSETPQSEGDPSPAVPDETPTAETTPVPDDAAPAADPDATQATPVAAAPAPVAAEPATASEDRRAGIFVPKWVAIVAAAIVAALVFGGIGYAIGDSSSDSGTTPSASVSPDTTNDQVPGNGPFGGNQVPNDNGDDDNGGQSTSNAGFLGVGVQPADAGVEVTDVASDSPAADAGLQAGDVITAIDGTDVSTPLALRAAVQEHSSGDEITVTYTRDGTSSTADVTLTSRPSQSS